MDLLYDMNQLMYDMGSVAAPDGDGGAVWVSRAKWEALRSDCVAYREQRDEYDRDAKDAQRELHEGLEEMVIEANKRIEVARNQLNLQQETIYRQGHADGYQLGLKQGRGPKR